jgi:hypothetical protein
MVLMGELLWVRYNEMDGTEVCAIVTALALSIASH